MGTAGHLQIIMWNECGILSVWWANLFHEIWFMDVQWSPSRFETLGSGKHVLVVVCVFAFDAFFLFMISLCIFQLNKYFMFILFGFVRCAKGIFQGSPYLKTFIYEHLLENIHKKQKKIIIILSFQWTATWQQSGSIRNRLNRTVSFSWMGHPRNTGNQKRRILSWYFGSIFR